METLYNQLIAGKQKAIVGFLITLIATYVAKYGFDLETLTVQQLIEQIAYGVIGYVGVYLKANK